MWIKERQACVKGKDILKSVGNSKAYGNKDKSLV